MIRHGTHMLTPTCQPIVTLPTGWQTHVGMPPTTPPRALSRWHTCEAKSLHRGLENQWLAHCHRAMGNRASPGFLEALALAWTLLYFLAVCSKQA